MNSSKLTNTTKNPLDWWSEDPKEHLDKMDYARIALGWIVCMAVIASAVFVL